MILADSAIRPCRADAGGDARHQLSDCRLTLHPTMGQRCFRREVVRAGTRNVRTPARRLPPSVGATYTARGTKPTITKLHGRSLPVGATTELAEINPAISWDSDASPLNS